MKTTISLREILAIDRKLNSFSSYMVLYCYRVAHHLYLKKSPLAKLWGGVKYLIYSFFRLDAQISEKAQIGKNIRLLHKGIGVVISSKAFIGNGVTIYHQVTVGINENIPEEQQSIYIGDNCYLSAGSKIISCHVGANSKIGPNAIVWKNVPANSLVVGQSIYKNEYYTSEKGKEKSINY